MGSDAPGLLPHRSSRISIHAPRVGSDQREPGGLHYRADFNPRSPCGERRPGKKRLGRPGNFNPRSPCGERQKCPMGWAGLLNFNPRSPCGERLAQVVGQPLVLDISIHAPRVGSDTAIPRHTHPAAYFNPRSPCGERQSRLHQDHGMHYFNPRSPCGERPPI